MTAKLDNANPLYQEGIQEGRTREAVERCTGAPYTQPSTGVRDGVEGFAEFFEPFRERNPVRDIRMVRAIEDGQYVVMRAAQSLNNRESRWITMDVFDTDEDDRIIERRDVITPLVDETVSGHSQVDGPTEVTDLDRTEANREHVAAFINDVFVHGRLDRITDYISSACLLHPAQPADTRWRREPCRVPATDG